MERRSVRARGAAVALVAACVAASASAAFEEDGSYYDGTWSARVECAGGAKCPARLVLADFAGTWQDLAGANAAKRVCAGKKIPITVQRSTPSQLAFTVWGDGSAACPVFGVLLKPVDAKTLVGAWRPGPHEDDNPEDDADAASAPSGSASGNAAAKRSAHAVRLERR